MPNISIGVDASRCRSGGSRAHIIGILSNIDLTKHGIKNIHLWTYSDLSNAIPDRSWLIKHTPKALDNGLLSQLFWQAFTLNRELSLSGCNILFTADASTFCRFKPMVVLSQDLLSFEAGIMRHYGIGKARLRLLLILLLQNSAFRTADGVIFLTRYAGKVIQQNCGPLRNVTYIPHGIDLKFKKVDRGHPLFHDIDRAIRCLYISNTAMYKNQWVVVRAIRILRNRGYNVSLTLIGGGTGKAQRLLAQEIVRCDPNGDLVDLLDFVSHDNLPFYLSNSDIFIFASSCETFGITLLEAMTVGLPIACSNRSSLPETLQDGGVYFDPTIDVSIADAVESILKNDLVRKRISIRAKQLSEQYSWQRCSDETWSFITDTYKNAKYG
jgi:glycosyltransferase involved in cell wall biosynthesis